MSKGKISYTPVLKKRNIDDKFGIINIRVTENRKSTYYPTGEKLHEDLWNTKQKEVRNNKSKISEDERNRLMSVIDKYLHDVKKVHLKKSGTESNTSKPTKNEQLYFLKYLLFEINDLEKNSNIGTSKKYKTTYYHLVEYLSTLNRGKDILFSDIDTFFVRDFETYLNSKIVRNKTHTIKTNTAKNYVNCMKRIYNKYLKLQLFIPQGNPFILFKNTREKVKKTSLQKKDIEKIVLLEFESSHPLYHTRNSFLFQVMSQGLRVGDMLTMRFEKIIEGRFEFSQNKTRKPHSILLNDSVIWIIKEYIDKDFTIRLGQISFSVNSLMKQRFNRTIDEKDWSLTFDELKKHYSNVTKSNPLFLILEGKISSEQVDKWSDYLNDVRQQIVKILLVLISEYSKRNKMKFIFPYLKNQDFENVVFDSNTKLSKFQYNQIQSKTSMYNDKLKEIQRLCGINIVLTSHVSRHSYTNLMLDGKFTGTGRTDVYDISKSLGHTRLSTTEHYLNDFSQERVDEPNIEMYKGFSYLL